MRAASWDCHRSVLRNDTHAGRTLDPTAPSEPIRCEKEYTAFRCRLNSGSPLRQKIMDMKSAVTWLVLALLLLNVLVACAPGPNQSKGTANEQGSVAGFWLGLWQGFIAPFVFVASLFKGNLGIYEVHNNGAWYNFGYLFGLACFFGGGGSGAARRGKSGS